MEEKKKKNIFLRILLILFIVYLALYLMDNLGYYNIASKNKIITYKAMQEFEQDVKQGKKIDIKEYIRDETDYKNSYSNLGYYLSNGIDTVLNKGFKNIGKLLEKLFK